MTSDTNYVDLDQMTQVKGKILNKISLTSDTNCKFRGSQSSCNSEKLAIILEHFPLRFDDSLE